MNGLFFGQLFHQLYTTSKILQMRGIFYLNIISSGLCDKTYHCFKSFKEKTNSVRNDVITNVLKALILRNEAAFK